MIHLSRYPRRGEHGEPHIQVFDVHRDLDPFLVAADMSRRNLVWEGGRGLTSAATKLTESPDLQCWTRVETLNPLS
jgi:hypothetical protein